jgi:hypothetical protein
VRASLAFTSTTLNPQCRAITCANVVLPVPVCVGGGGEQQPRNDNYKHNVSAAALASQLGGLPGVGDHAGTVLPACCCIPECLGLLDWRGPPLLLSVHAFLWCAGVSDVFIIQPECWCTVSVRQSSKLVCSAQT